MSLRVATPSLLLRAPPRLTRSCLFPQGVIVVGQLGLLCLFHLALVLLGHRVDQSGDETGPDRAHRAKVDWVAEKDHARRGDGELVERSDHAIRGNICEKQVSYVR